MGPPAAGSELGDPPQTLFLLSASQGLFVSLGYIRRVLGTAALPFWLLLKMIFPSVFIMPVSRNLTDYSPGIGPGLGVTCGL